LEEEGYYIDGKEEGVWVIVDSLGYINKGNYKNTEYHFSRCLSIPNFYNLDLDKVKKISFIINNLTK